MTHETTDQLFTQPYLPRNHPDPVPLAEAINDLMEEIEHEARHQQSTGPETPVGSIYLPTGFADLEPARLLGPQTSTVLFGAPGAGTSTLALNITRACALGRSRIGEPARPDTVPVLHVSWELPRREHLLRLLAAEAGTPINHLRAGTMRDEDWTKVAGVMSRVQDAPLMFARGPRTVGRLRQMIADWRAQHEQAMGALVVLDGLPLLARLTHNPAGEQGVWEDHSRLSAEVKDIAHELDVSIVSTVAVNRDYTRRTDHQLMLSDVAYSPAYITDADSVIAVHRPDLWNLEERPGEADLRVLKAKAFPAFQVTVAFQGHYARFHDMAP